MSTLYLDCEFNGMGGELLSMALVQSDGRFFYREVEPTGPLAPWVAENVAPKFDGEPVSYADFCDLLWEFLGEDQCCTIVADAPADFAYLARALEYLDEDGGYHCFSGRLTFEYRPDVRSAPINPHHALSDATALMVACEDASPRSDTRDASDV